MDIKWTEDYRTVDRDRCMLTSTVVMGNDFLAGAKDTDELATRINSLVRQHIDGCIRELESEECGPVASIEVVNKGLCMVFEVVVSGKEIETFDAG